MNKLINGIPDDTAEILTRRAQDLGLKNVSALIRMILVQEARKIEEQEKKEQGEKDALIRMILVQEARKIEEQKKIAQ